MRNLEQVIHPAADANFDEYVYVKVYASSAATPTINGTEVGLIAGVTLDILVKTISSTANTFVIGYKKMIPPKVING